MQQKRITKAIIPVAGLGTRFLPATKAQPKEMLTLVDKPVIQYIVEEAVDAGITDIILITSKNKRLLEDHFDRDVELENKLIEKGKKKEAESIKKISNLANFVFIRQKEQRGDGDAILAAKNVIGEEPVVVLYGDDIISGANTVMKLIDLYERYGDPVIAVDNVPKKQVSSYGIIDGKKMDDRVYHVRTLVEKPSIEKAPSTLAAVGKYVITPDVIRALEKIKVKAGAELRLADALKQIALSHSVYAYEVEGRRFDCGSKLGFLQATIHYAMQHPELRDEFAAFLNKKRY